MPRPPLTKLQGVAGLLFDYGGTLDTAAHHWARVLWQAYQSIGAPISEDLFRRAYVYGERALACSPIVAPDDNFLELLKKKVAQEAAYLQQSAPWHPDAEQEQAIAFFAYRYAARHVAAAKPLLAQLGRRYPMALVTNFYGNMHAVLRDFDLACFSTVVESACVGVRKPDPAIWRLGVKALGLPPEQVACVGDSFDKDVLPARAVGCQTIWFKGEGWTDTTYDETLPTAVITSLTDLLQLL